jgi:AmmeMemoRadiSam system protein A
MTTHDGPLSPEEGREALALVRRSLEHYLKTGGMLPHPEPFAGGLALHCGAFVTLRGGGGELRGCIGHMVSDRPLGELLIELAVAAGTRDPRFAPVRASELGGLRCEISVLTPMKPSSAEEVIPGRHGLYIRRGSASGVLLPQVATEQGWDRITFLSQTCRKAGLPENAWQDPDTDILTFTAQIIE